MFHAKVVEKIKTQILCSITFFFEDRAVYEIMWKNIVDPGRPQMTIWRISIASWIRTATNTQSEYAILFVYPLLQRLYERVLMLHYAFTICLVIFCSQKNHISNFDGYCKKTVALRTLFTGHARM
jgi:hypothetical protein